MSGPTIEAAATDLQAALDALAEPQVAAALGALANVERAKGRLTASISSAEAEAIAGAQPQIDPDLIRDAGAHAGARPEAGQ